MSLSFGGGGGNTKRSRMLRARIGRLYKRTTFQSGINTQLRRGQITKSAAKSALRKFHRDSHGRFS